MNIGSTTIPETLREGRYVLGRVLGQGGMAVVTTAHDNELGVDRAVKLLLASGRTRQSLRRRLKAEARAMARLNHPNILSIHDVGVEGELDYVVMDLAVGGSLQDQLTENGPLRPSVAIQYLIQVLSALAAAHAAGIVHRDVKPHNILLDAQGRAMLADFGIALLTGDDRRTRSGVAMGSLAFMPPEQRLDAAKVGPAADIYACGSTLFNLLTGENPVDLFLASERSPRWQGVPEVLQGVIRRACTMEPEDRWAKAGDLAYALLEILRADSDGFSTAEGPFGPTFPEPSVGFSKHTTGSHPTSTMVPATASSATAHAVEALEKVAPPPSDPLAEHQPTVTSQEPEPAEAGPPHPTWAPTLQVEPDSAPLAPPDRRGVYAVVGAALMVALFAVGLWMYPVLDGGTDTSREGSDGVVQPASAAHGAVQPEPSEPQAEPTPEPRSEPVGADAQPPDPQQAPPDPPPRPAEPAPAPPTESPVAAAPSTVPPPEPAATAVASEVAGRWEGTMGGAFVELELQGEDGGLRGRMQTSIGAAVSEQPVRGVFTATTGQLVLHETEARPPARFELTHRDEGLHGSVIKATGARGPVVLTRP